jgi:hypothetical protein
MIATTLIERVRLPRFETLRVTSHRSLQIWLGLAVLSLGVFVCVIDRLPALMALPESIPLFQPTVGLLGMVSRSLPAFVHVFAFSVRTAAFMGNRRYAALGASATWFLISSAFEFGQRSAIARRLVELMPSWLQKIPILDRSDAFFRHGTFDPLGLLSIVLAAFAIYVVIQRTQFRRTNHD